VEDCFGVVGVLDCLGYTQNVATFADIILDIFVGAFIRELGHFYLFRCKLFVKVEEIERRRGQVFDAGEKDRGL